LQYICEYGGRIIHAVRSTRCPGLAAVADGDGRWGQAKKNRVGKMHRVPVRNKEKSAKNRPVPFFRFSIKKKLTKEV